MLLALWFRGYEAAHVFRAEQGLALDAARSSAGLGMPPSARSTAPAPARRLDEGVLGRIVIPRLGISAMIAEGAGPRQLGRAIGHIPSSAFPGEKGNCALAGHRDSFLRDLGRVRKKDLIVIETPTESYTYRVEWGSVIKPEQVAVLDDTREPSLTLVTCYPFAMIGPAPERFVVRAKLVEATD